MIQKLISLVTALAFLGCSTVNTQLAGTAISAGVNAGLRFGIKDARQRATVANYLYVSAGALRSIVGTPTPDALTIQINAFIPASIKNDYPELITMVVPIVVSLYQTALAKYGNDAPKIYAVLNSIATNIEIGAASYRTTGQLAFNLEGRQYAFLR